MVQNTHSSLSQKINKLMTDNPNMSDAELSHRIQTVVDDHNMYYPSNSHLNSYNHSHDRSYERNHRRHSYSYTPMSTTIYHPPVFSMPTPMFSMNFPRVDIDKEMMDIDAKFDDFEKSFTTTTTVPPMMSSSSSRNDINNESQNITSGSSKHVKYYSSVTSYDQNGVKTTKTVSGVEDEKDGQKSSHKKMITTDETGTTVREILPDGSKKVSKK